MSKTDEVEWRRVDGERVTRKGCVVDRLTEQKKEFGSGVMSDVSRYCVTKS